MKGRKSIDALPFCVVIHNLIKAKKTCNISLFPYNLHLKKIASKKNNAYVVGFIMTETEDDIIPVALTDTMK